MTYEFDTAVLCLLGWLLHWLGSWGEARKVTKIDLVKYVQATPATFWFSVIATLAIYLMGPGILPSIGIDLPDSPGIKLLGSFLVGYSADSIVYKVAALLRKVE